MIDLLLPAPQNLPPKPVSKTEVVAEAAPAAPISEIQVTEPIQQLRKYFDTTYNQAGVDTAPRFLEELNRPAEGFQLDQLSYGVYFLSNPNVTSVTDAWSKQAFQNSPVVLQTTNLIHKLEVKNDKGFQQRVKIILTTAALEKQWGGVSFEGSYAFQDLPEDENGRTPGGECDQDCTNTRVYVVIIDSHMFQAGPVNTEFSEFIADELGDQLTT